MVLGASSGSKRAIVYWLATTGADGAPHLIPIWGAWVGDRWYVEGGPTRWQRNLRENPQMAIHIEIGDEVVIVEGTATELVAPGRAARRRDPGRLCEVQGGRGLRGERRPLDRRRAVGAAPGQGVRLVRLPRRHDAVPLRRGTPRRPCHNPRARGARPTRTGDDPGARPGRRSEREPSKEPCPHDRRNVHLGHQEGSRPDAQGRRHHGRRHARSGQDRRGCRRRRRDGARARPGRHPRGRRRRPHVRSRR